MNGSFRLVVAAAAADSLLVKTVAAVAFPPLFYPETSVPWRHWNPV